MLSYDMESRGRASRYEYLYRCIRHDIAHGVIAPGEKLPSKRALAKHLGVGVITVEAAYTQLVAEGYVRAEERRGYFACKLAPAAQVDYPWSGLRSQGTSASFSHVREGEGEGKWEESAPRAREGSREREGGRCGSATRATSALREAEGAPASAAVPALAANSPHAPARPPASAAPAFSGLAATSLFPYTSWSKAMRRTLADETPASLAEAAGARGSLRLRRAISAYLRECRGMDAPAERIVVAAGSQVLYQLIVQLLGRDRTFAVETPGYSLLEKTYRAQGVCVATVGVDGEGVDMRALRESCADVAHVMPAHQFPTGVVASAARRRDLLNWSRKKTYSTCDNAESSRDDGSASIHGRFIVEDDYDAEFRMTGRPIPPLASIDSAGRVIYLNSFAKSLGAAFRIAYMVLPPQLSDVFNAELGFYSNTVSPLEQLALARFIEQGSYERHVNRMRTQAKRAQDRVACALRESGIGVEVRGLDCGLHFIVLSKGVDAERLMRENDLSRICNALGARVVPLREFASRACCRQRRGAMEREQDGCELGIWSDCYMVNCEHVITLGM